MCSTFSTLLQLRNFAILNYTGFIKIMKKNKKKKTKTKADTDGHKGNERDNDDGGSLRDDSQDLSALPDTTYYLVLTTSLLTTLLLTTYYLLLTTYYLVLST